MTSLALQIVKTNPLARRPAPQPIYAWDKQTGRRIAISLDQESPTNGRDAFRLCDDKKVLDRIIRAVERERGASLAIRAADQAPPTLLGISLAPPPHGRQGSPFPARPQNRHAQPHSVLSKVIHETNDVLFKETSAFMTSNAVLAGATFLVKTLSLTISPVLFSLLGLVAEKGPLIGAAFWDAKRQENQGFKLSQHPNLSFLMDRLAGHSPELARKLSACLEESAATHRGQTCIRGLENSLNILHVDLYHDLYYLGLNTFFLSLFMSPAAPTNFYEADSLATTALVFLINTFALTAAVPPAVITCRTVKHFLGIKHLP